MRELAEAGHSSEDTLKGAPKCFLLNVKQVEHYWKQIEEGLDEDPELWNKSYDKSDILARVLSGLLQVWVVETNEILHLVFMTQRYERVNDTAVLQVFWMWGRDLKASVQTIDLALDRLAAFTNCSWIEVVGRKGFEHYGKPLGWTYDYSVFSRKVRKQRGN